MIVPRFLIRLGRRRGGTTKWWVWTKFTNTLEEYSSPARSLLNKSIGGTTPLRPRRITKEGNWLSPPPALRATSPKGG